MNLTSPALTLASALFLAATPISFADTTPAGVIRQESRARPRSEILAAKRVVFLGDSITANATYVMNVAAALRSQKLASGGPEVLSLGLSSETVSGLSEDGHPFPRPCVHERLTRLLAALKADVIFACYGMNCGIYQPLDEERFEAFRAGMEKLHGEAAAAGARIIHITPPYFDPARKPTQGYYPEVLSRYSQWLVSQAERGWEVIDLHSAMREEALRRKAVDPTFTFSNDGVHPGSEGHWLMAKQILTWLGDTEAAKTTSIENLLQQRHVPAEVQPLVEQRVKLTKDSWVQAIGHNRPGVAKGLPPEIAAEKAAAIDSQIDALLR